MREKGDKNMDYEKLEGLSRIYNTFLLVNTKGEDTIIMADCLKALKEFIINEKKEIDNQPKEE